MIKYKLLGYINKISPFTGKSTRYVKIEIPMEMTRVKGLTLYVNHIYVAPASKDNHPSKLINYWEPFNNPDFNLKKDFNAYRKHQGLMMPNQIKSLRKQHYNLSQRELAAVLGLSYSTISKIEDDNIIQSISQDSALRLLLDPKEMVNLIKARLPITKKYQHVNSDVLIKKAKAIK